MGEPLLTPPDDARDFITSRIEPIEQTYYLVTPETLQAYAAAGHFSNLFLTIFGICVGGFLTCWVAVGTSAVSKEVQTAVSTAMYFLLAFGVVFLILSVVFLIIGRTQRSAIFKQPFPPISRQP